MCAILATMAIAAGDGSSSAYVALWPANGNTPQVTGAAADAAMTGTASLKLDWKTTLDGGVIASPVAFSSPSTGVVEIVATEDGSVYALGRGGTTLWRTHFGAVVAGKGCGTYGVSSTPAIDTTRSLVYVANADGYVYALRLADGSEAPGWPVKVVSRPHTEYIWGGLRLVGTRLYIPVASYCDATGASNLPAEGRVESLDVSQPSAAPVVFDPAPGPDNLAGAWGWGGVSVAASGNAIYFGVGNAEPDVDAGFSDSMIEVTPDLQHVDGAYRPEDAAPGRDIDFGAAPVLFQPKGCVPMLAANDKDGTLLVWKQNALSAGPTQTLPLNDDVVFVGAPSWDAKRQMLFDGGTTGLQKGKRVVGTTGIAVAGCKLVKRWFQTEGTGTQPQPLVAGDLVFSAGGGSGGFEASRAVTGVPVWRYPTSAPTVSPAILAGKDVVAGDQLGGVYAFTTTR